MEDMFIWDVYVYYLIFRRSISHGSQNLSTSSEDLDVQDRDVEGVRSPDQGMRSHSVLIRPAQSFFSRLHSPF